MEKVSSDAKWCYYAKHHPSASEFGPGANRCRKCDADRKRRSRAAQAPLRDFRLESTRGPLSLEGRLRALRSFFFRTCSGECKKELPLSRFPNNRADSKGRGWQCLDCDRVAAAAWAAANPVRSRSKNRRAHLRRVYRMTLSEYDEMLSAQGGVCACCGAEPEEDRYLDVDHDHSHCDECNGPRSCGESIRGIVCGDCNRYVLPVIERGNGDRLDPALRRGGEAYLRRYAEQLLSSEAIAA